MSDATPSVEAPPPPPPPRVFEDTLGKQPDRTTPPAKLHGSVQHHIEAMQDTDNGAPSTPFQSTQEELSALLEAIARVKREAIAQELIVGEWKVCFSCRPGRAPGKAGDLLLKHPVLGRLRSVKELRQRLSSPATPSPGIPEEAKQIAPPLAPQTEGEPATEREP